MSIGKSFFTIISCKRPRDKDRGEERCDEEGSGTVKSEAWRRWSQVGCCPEGLWPRKVQRAEVKEDLN